MSRRTKNNCAVLACTLSAAAASMSHAAITQVDYSAVVANTTENFSGFASGGSGPRDTIVQGNGLSFGERFAGQQLGTQTIEFPGFYTGPYDVLSGSPTSALTLEAGLVTEASRCCLTRTSRNWASGSAARMAPQVS